ncbi:Na+/H+ antiporter subunit G [Rhodoferax antarcticus]|uniref:Monovalent cation/proton antiporter, MnhG/PhaG subunit n=1 Tax=Rhodoferax antarcticus ANT.BR TaxID=1111071 RepID=A0A1Q8YE72_9BURK|nr:Na+/H+ antiporter subunit G [Rhodoferax antarcticus]APW46153.1 Na+/H+ antiporter subunit G [Rhodoferax antarcticus]MCW2314166.1 multicomponent K+:H+ antiporter subunit G [Rhodoferax antarcticus]OLP06333.1 monovalent cation/proton antiporter, MnhG/PhaG subunit [Rhodoferax antarcticus ANT.BR]
MSSTTEILLSALVLIGAAFTFIGSLGLVRFKDFYTRLHAPTKASTLGVGGLLIASSVFFSVTGEALSLHEILVSLFLLITAPISAHLLAKAALHLRLPSVTPLPDAAHEPVTAANPPAAVRE